MSHRIYRIIQVEIVADYTLQITFDDDATQTINFLPVLEGALFGPLQDKVLFNQVEIDPEVHTIVWPNGADFDPETLHDWPKYVDKIKQLANQWAESSTKVI